MSRLPFTVSPVLYRRSVADKLAPNGFIVHKKKSRFGLCVALCAAIAFLVPFASQAFANEGSLFAVFELRVELNGSLYVADTGLTGDDCVLQTYQIDSIVDEHGNRVSVPKDAPVYCVSM